MHYRPNEMGVTLIFRRNKASRCDPINVGMPAFEFEFFCQDSVGAYSDNSDTAK